MWLKRVGLGGSVLMTFAASPSPLSGAPGMSPTPGTPGASPAAGARLLAIASPRRQLRGRGCEWGGPAGTGASPRGQPGPSLPAPEALTDLRGIPEGKRFDPGAGPSLRAVPFPPLLSPSRAGNRRKFPRVFVLRSPTTHGFELCSVGVTAKRDGEVQLQTKRAVPFHCFHHISWGIHLLSSPGNQRHPMKGVSVRAGAANGSRIGSSAPPCQPQRQEPGSAPLSDDAPLLWVLFGEKEV